MQVGRYAVRYANIQRTKRDSLSRFVRWISLIRAVDIQVKGFGYWGIGGNSKLFSLNMGFVCSPIVKAQQPGVEDLRKLVRGLLGPWVEFIAAPRPSFWPTDLELPPSFRGYNNLRTSSLINII